MNNYRKVYIQTQYNDWLNENCFTSQVGFNLMGYDVRKFDMSEVSYIELDKNIIFHGGVNTIRKRFDLLGVKQPEIHQPHKYLTQYTGREFTETNLYEVRNKYNQYPYFIKPLDGHKTFTGLVIKNNFLDLLKIKQIPDETKVLMSSVVNFVAEYRCFILNKNLVGCKNYTGDFEKIINFNIVNDAINNYIEQPIAYSLDFGVTDKGETLLIEINDGFSLGHYGLNPIIYCKMIEARWKEITNT